MRAAADGRRRCAAQSLCNVHLGKRVSRYPLERSRLGEALEHERYVRRRATEGDKAELGELLDNERERRHLNAKRRRVLSARREGHTLPTFAS